MIFLNHLQIDLSFMMKEVAEDFFFKSAQRFNLLPTTFALRNYK